MHGFYLISAIWSKGIVNKAYNFIGLRENSKGRKIIDVLWTFHLVLIGWVFFRANSLNDAIYILSNALDFSSMSINNVLFGAINLGLKKYDIIIAISSILILELVHFKQRKTKMREFLSGKPIALRWSLYIAIFYSILLLGVFNLTEFIYFQF